MSTIDRDGLSHSQPEEAVEEDEDADDDEVESGKSEEGEEVAEDDAVFMEDDDENESDKVDEGDNDDGDDDNEEEVIELDTESAGLFAAFAALRGQNTEVLKTLLGNFPLPSDGTNC